MSTKICARCGEEKLLEEYPIDNHLKDGHKSRCKLCLKSLKKTSTSTKKSPAMIDAENAECAEVVKLICQIIKKYDSSLSDKNYIEVMKKVQEYRDHNRHPPTSEFSVYEKELKNPAGDFETSRLFIESALKVFLKEVKDYEGEGYRIVMSNRYKTIGRIKVQLPEEITFTKKELDSFRNIIERREDIHFHRLEITLGKHVLTHGEVAKVFCDALAGHAIVCHPDDITLKYKSRSRGYISWPKSLVIGDDIVQELHRAFSEYFAQKMEKLREEEADKVSGQMIRDLHSALPPREEIRGLYEGVNEILSILKKRGTKKLPPLPVLSPCLTAPIVEPPIVEAPIVEAPPSPEYQIDLDESEGGELNVLKLDRQLKEVEFIPVMNEQVEPSRKLYDPSSDEWTVEQFVWELEKKNKIMRESHMRNRVIESVYRLVDEGHHIGSGEHKNNPITGKVELSIPIYRDDGSTGASVRVKEKAKRYLFDRIKEGRFIRIVLPEEESDLLYEIRMIE
jgi:hypothetical protein